MSTTTTRVVAAVVALAMVLAGLAILFGLARYLDWWRTAQKVTVRSSDAAAESARGAIATPDEPLTPILKTRRPV